MGDREPGLRGQMNLRGPMGEDKSERGACPSNFEIRHKHFFNKIRYKTKRLPSGDTLKKKLRSWDTLNTQHSLHKEGESLKKEAAFQGFNPKHRSFSKERRCLPGVR